MSTVNMLEAKSSLSRLVADLESGVEREIVIARNGRPAARLVPLEAVPASQRIGVAKGVFEVPDTIDTDNAAIEQMLADGAPE